jgi:rRNA processing protein Gar1
MELLGDVGHVESCFGTLGTVFVLVQDRCTVYAKRTIGSEIILDRPDGTPR